MEIQKIFSEIDTDERLYSVLLSDDELALFSEIQKEFNSKAAKERNNKWRHSQVQSASEIEKSATNRAFLQETKEAPISFMRQTKKLKPWQSADPLVRENLRLIKKGKVADNYLQKDINIGGVVNPERIREASGKYGNSKHKAYWGPMNEFHAGLISSEERARDRAVLQRRESLEEGVNKIKELNKKYETFDKIRENKKLPNKIKRGLKRIISKIK